LLSIFKQIADPFGGDSNPELSPAEILAIKSEQVLLVHQALQALDRSAGSEGSLKGSEPITAELGLARESSRPEGLVVKEMTDLVNR
jgi:hypothetical protein